MSHLSSIFNKVPVKVQKRSGFDLSHENLFTAKVGTLIPASVEEVLPGDVVSIGSALAVELPPLATNFKGRVDARLEAFFVPNRILWGAWQDFITRDINSVPSTATGVTGGSGVTVPSYDVPTQVPLVKITNSMAGAGTLTDYLGYKGNSTGAVLPEVNALPYAAYWKIWDDWYRDSNIQQPFFYNSMPFSSSYVVSTIGASRLPVNGSTGVLSDTGVTFTSAYSMRGVNGKLITDLAQRNFAKDYFTTMTYRPQAGEGASLKFNVDSLASTATFTIAQLRAANSLQKWLERNNISGTRYYDQILAHFGVVPSDAAFQRPVLLGSMTTPVIVNSISQTASVDSAGSTSNGNPYGFGAGAQFGKGTSFGKDTLVDSFEVKEHGFIFVMFSLVPHAYYSTGARRYLFNYKSSDYAFPEFANIGDQVVTAKELGSNYTSVSQMDAEVGYVQRYAHYKYHDDEVHGLLADGQSLDAFVLSRGFDNAPTLGSSMLEIPTDYMDNVMVTETNVSGFNAIVDAYFDSKVLRVLPEYSLPSLSDDPDGDGKKVYVPKGGTRL